MGTRDIIHITHTHTLTQTGSRAFLYKQMREREARTHQTRSIRAIIRAATVRVYVVGGMLLMLPLNSSYYIGRKSRSKNNKCARRNLLCAARETPVLHVYIIHISFSSKRLFLIKDLYIYIRNWRDRVAEFIAPAVMVKHTLPPPPRVLFKIVYITAHTHTAREGPPHQKYSFLSIFSHSLYIFQSIIVAHTHTHIRGI